MFWEGGDDGRAGIIRPSQSKQEARQRTRALILVAGLNPEATINMLLFLLDRRDVVAAIKRLRGLRAPRGEMNPAGCG